MSNCVMCGSSLPKNQGSRTCSMCYGDVDHGKDNYYRDYIERQQDHDEQKRLEQEREQERE